MLIVISVKDYKYSINCEIVQLSVDMEGAQRAPKSSSRKAKEKLSKEKLLEALNKKKKCNAKAQSIVEGCLGPVKPEQFLAELGNINQGHYDDIVEERSLLKLCGYPVCNEILVSIPKKQYHISTTENRVYDITERKKFCSNNCFKASNYIKEQISTSPLWLRDQETLPEFKLLNLVDSPQNT